MNGKVLIVAMVGGVLAGAPARAGLLQTLGSDWPYDVDGHNVVGVKGNGLGFLYNDLTQTSTTLPKLNNRNTPALGISGDYIIGGYVDLAGNDFGYLYSISAGTYTTLSHPLADPGVQNGTKPTGIDGDRVVGNYWDAAGKQHGFVYDIGSESWTTLDYPGAVNMALEGVSGNYIVGTYNTGNPFFPNPLLYDLATSTWTSIPILPRGIDGDNVVGFWQGATPDGAAIYNLVDGTYVNPLIGVTFPAGQIVQSVTFNGIDGNTVVGTYRFWNGRVFVNSGFVYIGVPEASSLLLLSLSAAGLALFARRRRGST